MTRARSRNAARALPALGMAALLALGATAPRRVAGPAPPPMAQTECRGAGSSASGSSTIRYSFGAGLTQPLPPGITVASCSVGVHPVGIAFPLFRIREWDPATLAPEPHTLALRALFLNPSTCQIFERLPRVAFVPPVITRSLEHVAERMRETTALEVGNTSNVTMNYNGPLEGFYDPDSPVALPPASGYTIDGWRVPLPGTHPVLAHDLCPGSEDVSRLRIAQSVNRPDTLLVTGAFEYLQRFRVPEAVEFRWAEMATSRGYSQALMPAAELPPAQLAIMEGDGTVPEAMRPVALVQTWFDPLSDERNTVFYLVPLPASDSWISHTDPNRKVILEPGHDYWIQLRSVSQYGLYARRVTSAESADFAAGVGGAYSRPDSVSGWQEHEGLALDFKIVGRPLLSGPGSATGSGIRLSVAPNPAPGAATMRWAGAVGPVMLEVFDARGHRVARTEGGAAGTWTLSGGDRQRMRPGMYFVRLRDSSGRERDERFAVVR